MLTEVSNREDTLLLPLTQGCLVMAYIFSPICERWDKDIYIILCGIRFGVLIGFFWCWNWTCHVMEKNCEPLQKDNLLVVFFGWLLTLLLESWQASCTNDSNQKPTYKKNPDYSGFCFCQNVFFKQTLQKEGLFFHFQQLSFLLVNHMHCCVDLLRSNKLFGFYHL